jgi:hypothetical protein
MKYSVFTNAIKNINLIGKKVIISLSLVLAAGYGFAQENGKPVSTLKMYRIEPATATTTKASGTTMTVEEEIQACKDHIAALDTKEAWIRSNPEELKMATENGWFEEAAATRAKLEARIKELESK